MSQWGGTDDAANSVNWAAQQLDKVANSVNKTNLFGNTTANSFVTNQKVGVFGASDAEVRADRAGGAEGLRSPGWQLRREGTGGRAGRVTNECLVAFSSGSFSADAEDAVFPDAVLSIVTQPSDASANSGDNEQAAFVIVASVVPDDVTINYSWEYTPNTANTDDFSSANVAGFANNDTDTLTVDSNTIANGTVLRVQLTATGADNVVSETATLTVT